MEQFVIVSLASFLASLLTFFSGFGLGTLLMPVFAIFFPVEVAIALTGVVHFLNNVFKLLLMGRHVDRSVAIRFGIPAFVFALLGALLLLQISDLPPWHTYQMGGKIYSITPVKVIIALTLLVFTFMELVPFLKNVTSSEKMLPVGGALSGFFGGLSGHQGALRSAFLVKSGLSKEAFIATGIVIACIVDISRLGVYMNGFSESGLSENMTLVTVATAFAFAGAFLGSRLLRKVTLKAVQIIVTVLLVILAIGLAAGIV